MAREPSKTFIDREVEIMNIAWGMGEASDELRLQAFERNRVAGKIIIGWFKTATA